MNMLMSVCTLAAIRMYRGRRGPRLQMDRSSRSCAARQKVLAAESSPGCAQKHLQQHQSTCYDIPVAERFQGSATVPEACLLS